MKKIKLYNSVKIIRLIVIGLVLAGSFLMGSFLYQNFYQSLSQSKVILVLRSEVALEIINPAVFEQVMEKWEQKKQAPEIDWSSFNDPF